MIMSVPMMGMPTCLGQLHGLGRRRLAAHEENGRDVGHLGGAHHLRVGQAGHQQTVGHVEAEHVAHQIRGEPGTDLAIQVGSVGEWMGFGEGE